MSKTTRRKQPQTPDALVKRFATLLSDPPQLDDVLADADPRALGLWDRLIDAVHREQGDKYPDNGGFERIKTALPEDMHLDFIRYCDHLSAMENVTMVAAYRVGVEVGRRLAGGVR